MLKILLILSVIVLTGCGGGGGAAADEIVDEIVNEAELQAEPMRFPEFGGTLYLTMRAPSTLNPLLNEDETVDRVLALLFERLFVSDDMGRAVPNPVIAQSYTMSADARSLTVVMREDIFWSDGSRVTAGDVAFSIDFLRTEAPVGAIYRPNVANVASTSVTGNSVRINLNSPDAFMAHMLKIPIIPAFHYRNVAHGNARQMRPVGNGPFVFESYVRGREVVLAASPLSLRSPAYIDNVVARVTVSDEVDINAVTSGVADALYLTDTGWSRVANRQGIRAQSILSRHFDFVGFNFNNPVFARQEARAAVAQAMPMGRILETVFLGEGVLAPTPVAPGTWLANDAVAHMDFELSQAAAYFREAGINYRQLELRILANVESFERTRVAEILADTLGSLGIAVRLYVLPWDEYRARLTAGEFDIFLAGYSMAPGPDMSRLFDPGNNPMRYRSPALDALLAETLAARGDDDKIDAYHNLQNYIASEMPIIGLVFRTQARLLNNRVNGPIGGAAVFGSVEQWYLETRY